MARRLLVASLAWLATLRRVAFPLAAGSFVAFSLGALSPGVPIARAAGVNTDLGKALYEHRCGVCHERSVHARDPRSAQTFQQIRAFVSRWDRELGAQWKADEIDAVTQYLNERYYHYVCPPEVCGLAAR